MPKKVNTLSLPTLSIVRSSAAYGLAGVGGLYTRRGIRIFPLLDGGVQENNIRAGAENLIGIIGTAKAAELARRDMDSNF